MVFIRDPGIWDPATRDPAEKAFCFLNMVLKNEEILSTQSEQAFEAMTILPMAKAIAVIVQK